MKTRSKIIVTAVIFIAAIFVINSVIPGILFRQQDNLGLILYTCTLGIDRMGPLMLIIYNNGTHTIDENSCIWIKNNIDDTYVEPEPEINVLECEPSRYEIIKNCLAIYNCDIENDTVLNERCVGYDQGVSVREMCFNPEDVIVQKSTGCLLLPKVGTTNCDVNFLCPDNLDGQ